MISQKAEGNGMQYASRTREPLRFACGDRCESIDSLVGETRTEPGQCSVSSEEIGILGQRDWQGGRKGGSFALGLWHQATKSFFLLSSSTSSAKITEAWHLSVLPHFLVANSSPPPFSRSLFYTHTQIHIHIYIFYFPG